MLIIFHRQVQRDKPCKVKSAGLLLFLRGGERRNKTGKEKRPVIKARTGLWMIHEGESTD